jgi:hypothetical protein
VILTFRKDQSPTAEGQACDFSFNGLNVSLKNSPVGQEKNFFGRRTFLEK